jgi:hypothetical protein
MGADHCRKSTIRLPAKRPVLCFAKAGRFRELCGRKLDHGRPETFPTGGSGREDQTAAAQPVCAILAVNLGPKGGYAMTTARASSESAATGERQLAAFINKFDSKNAALIRSLRKALRKRLPSANELVYDNYNFFVIGYCSTERPSDCIISIAAAANGVGLSFYHGASLPDPHKLLSGSGTQNRFIRIESVGTLARPAVEELVAAAIAQAGRALPSSGRGKLVIRSISEKQKPRRKTAD